jgi:hypothetical protein
MSIQNIVDPIFKKKKHWIDVSLIFFKKNKLNFDLIN